MTFTRGGFGPSAEQNFDDRELPPMLNAVKERRLAAYQKAQVELLVAGARIRAEVDERDGRGTVWRTRDDDRVFEPLRQMREPGAGPDAVAMVFGDTESDIRFVELRLLDAEVYQLEASRHAKVVERAEAEQAAYEAAFERARRDAPKHILAGPSGWSLAELLASVARTCGVLTLHDDRVLVQLPSEHLLLPEQHYSQQVERLRPLLVTTKLGTIAVPCDLDGCTRSAGHVAVGGAFVCTEHL
jgi:hypothetical protein